MEKAAFTEDVLGNFKDLQESLLQGFEFYEDDSYFISDSWERPEGGSGRTCVLSEGDCFEKAGIAFSHVKGDRLPASASRRDISDRPFEAMGVSLVIHPRSPMVPTAHMNVRFFKSSHNATGEPVWWFGGGYDLTPYYGNKEDCIHWHKTAKSVCEHHFGSDFYEAKKKECDEYFYIKHRNSARGIGGVFFDDLNEPEFQACFAFVSDLGRSFADAYFPIVERRRQDPYSEDERQFQLYRRGRYVEFNLVYDRGTLFGLQSGGRIESILMSLPPLVRFDYNPQFDPDSREGRLEKDFLEPRDWAEMEIA